MWYDTALLGGVVTQHGRIRLRPFTEAIGWDRGAFRAIAADGRVPFRTDRVEGGQQTYGGKEVFAMIIFGILTRRGMRQEVAALDIIRSGCVAAFLDGLEAGTQAGLCLVLPDSAPPKAMSRVHPPSVMKADDIGAFIAAAIAGGASEEGATYLRSLTIVPLAPAYRAAQERAKEAGFYLEGSAIWKIDTAEVTDEGAE